MPILQTILTVSSDDADDDIYDAIDEILSRAMPNVLGNRAWLEFVINKLANDAIITCFKTDEYDIDSSNLSGKWDKAYEILCKHVTAAAAEIRVLSLREDVDKVG
jgi:hypothetical protein